MSNVEKVETNVVSFEFSVTPEQFNKAIDQAYKKNVKNINIQGFRRGKAPRMIIEKFYGKEVFYEDAINIVLPDAYDKAIDDNDISPVDQPEIDIKGEISLDNDIIFTAKVTVKPEFELGEYKGVEYEKVSYRTLKKDIDAEIDKLRDRNSRLVSVEDRAVQNDDTVTIDFDGFVDGVPFEGGKGENFDLTIGSGQFIPGFEEQLIGKNIDEEVEVNVTFPEEYHAEDLKGKSATFKVLIHSIKVKELPELDDEFAQDVSEFNTLEELQKDTKEKIAKENKEKAQHENEEKVVAAVCENTEVEIPEAMINTQIESMIKDLDMNMRYQGLELSQYMQYTGQTIEMLKEQYKEEAQKRVKTSLVLEKVSQVEDISVNDEDIENEYKNICSQNGMNIDDVKKYIQIEEIKERVKAEKTIAFLMKNAVNK
ncbi:MAG: trigger factor [Oscillospiraceae bacterium]